MEKEYIEKIVEVEQRSKSNAKRLDEHDKRLEELSDVYIALTKVNDKVDNIDNDVNEIKQDIKEIKEKPNKRLDLIWGYIVSTLIGGIVGFILINVGMK